MKRKRKVVNIYIRVKLFSKMENFKENFRFFMLENFSF